MNQETKQAKVTIKSVYLNLECSNCNSDFSRYLTASSRHTGKKFITYTIEVHHNYYGLCNQCIKELKGIEL